jgi:hypothetical protein
VAKWIKFSINFATLENDDEDDLLNQITDACIAIVDPVCYKLGDKEPPKGHRCTRDWTAGATSMTDIADEDLTDDEFEEIFDAAESASCSMCGRPLPDQTHMIPKLRVSLEQTK